MEIDYGRGAMKEKTIISDILEELPTLPLCPMNVTSNVYFLTHDRIDDLVGNVTAALFSSMGITPSEDRDISQLNNNQLLMMYVEVLGFVYVYFFVVASIAMFLFAAFMLLAHRHQRKLYVGIGAAVRLVLAVLVLGVVSFVRQFALAYAFMTSPVILYAFTVILLTGET
jgi:heme A synthase